MNEKRILRAVFGTVMLVVLELGGCGMSEVPINQNEALRPKPEDVGSYTQRAQTGDADAAMRLWQHYEFAENDHQQGLYWKRQFDKLKAQERSH
jgi:hypothetical protein